MCLEYITYSYDLEVECILICLTKDRSQFCLKTASRTTYFAVACDFIFDLFLFDEVR